MEVRLTVIEKKDKMREMWEKMSIKRWEDLGNGRHKLILRCEENEADSIKKCKTGAELCKVYFKEKRK